MSVSRPAVHPLLVSVVFSSVTLSPSLVVDTSLDSTIEYQAPRLFQDSLETHIGLPYLTVPVRSAFLVGTISGLRLLS